MVDRVSCSDGRCGCWHGTTLIRSLLLSVSPLLPSPLALERSCVRLTVALLLPSICQYLGTDLMARAELKAIERRRVVRDFERFPGDTGSSEVQGELGRRLSS